jgi:hypothetical protein
MKRICCLLVLVACFLPARRTSSAEIDTRRRELLDAGRGCPHWPLKQRLLRAVLAGNQRETAASDSVLTDAGAHALRRTFGAMVAERGVLGKSLRRIAIQR